MSLVEIALTGYATGLVAGLVAGLIRKGVNSKQ